MGAGLQRAFAAAEATRTGIIKAATISDCHKFRYRLTRYWVAQKVDKEGSYSLVGTSIVKRRVDVSDMRHAEGTKRITEAVAAFKAVLLLEITLPCGKKLRDATGAECAKAGGFYAEVARHVKPTQVVDKHLNEKDLREIQSRYAGGKRSGAGAALHA